MIDLLCNMYIKNLVVLFTLCIVVSSNAAAIPLRASSCILSCADQFENDSLCEIERNACMANCHQPSNSMHSSDLSSK